MMSKEAASIIDWALSNKDLPAPNYEINFWDEAETLLTRLNEK